MGQRHISEMVFFFVFKHTGFGSISLELLALYWLCKGVIYYLDNISGYSSNLTTRVKWGKSKTQELAHLLGKQSLLLLITTVLVTVSMVYQE